MDKLRKVKILKNIITVMFFALLATAVCTFVYSCFTGGNMLKFVIFFSSSILAFNSYLVMRLAKKAVVKLS